MAKRLLLTISMLSLQLLVLSVSGIMQPKADPIERIVGVEVGNWVKYGDFMSTWWSNDPVAHPEAFLIETNETLWVKNTVLSISGTQINFQMVTRYKNGTETTSVEIVDVYSGGGNGTTLFVSAGLSAPDTIYAIGSDKINETISREYIGLYRQTNHLNASSVEYPDPYDLSDFVSMYVDHYWDKATGVLCERLGTFAHYRDSYVSLSSITQKIIETDLWGPNVSDKTDPVADAGLDQTVEVGTTVTFDAGGSIDNMGIALYEWDFGDGTYGNGIVATHIYTASGTYTVTLAVKDAAGNSDTDTITVTIEEATWSPSPTPPIIGLLAITGLAVLLGLFFWRLRSAKTRRKG